MALIPHRAHRKEKEDETQILDHPYGVCDNARHGVRTDRM